MTVLGALLPLVGFGLLWSLATIHRASLGMGRLSVRGTFVVAFILLQAVLLVMTETLSVDDRLTDSTVLAAWLLVDALAALGLVASVDRQRIGRRLRSFSPKGLARLVGRQPNEVVFCVTAIAIIVSLLFVIGALYPPSNTDSLVYHLPRVSHWIQQESVRHFATHYTAQIELAPLHEFNLLHLHLLTGSDRLDGYVQLGAFVVCIVGAAEIARLLGARIETQAVAALICAVIPSAILEATSTQNNLFAAAVGLSLVVLLLAWEPRGRWLGLGITLGLSAGLAYLAKGILLPLVGPVLLILAVRLVVKEARSSSWTFAWRRALSASAVALICALCMAGPFLKRNHDLFGSFSGPVTATTVNAEFAERAMAANLLRSVAVNFRIGDGRSGTDTLVSKAVLGGLGELHEALGVPLDDPQFFLGTEFDAFEFADYSLWTRVEEYGANPWHVFLLCFAGASLAFAALVRREERARLPALLALGLTIGFIAFSVTAKWSVFVTRYQVPSLVLWAPLIALVLAELNRYVRLVIVGLLFVACMPQLLDNSARSLIEPNLDFESDLDGYFQGPGGYDYLEVRDAIVASDCKSVGIANWILLEYPIWAGLENTDWDGRIEHVNVNPANPSSSLQRPDFQPCALVRAVDGPTLPPDIDWVETPHGRLTLALEPEFARSAS